MQQPTTSAGSPNATQPTTKDTPWSMQQPTTSAGSPNSTQATSLLQNPPTSSDDEEEAKRSSQPDKGHDDTPAPSGSWNPFNFIASNKTANPETEDKGKTRVRLQRVRKESDTESKKSNLKQRKQSIKLKKFLIDKKRVSFGNKARSGVEMSVSAHRVASSEL
jgi:hypothetical protein